jgi:hypothetical protein
MQLLNTLLPSHKKLVDDFLLSGRTTLNAKRIFLRKHTKGKQFVFSRYFLRKY